jgi:hypothetical protein
MIGGDDSIVMEVAVVMMLSIFFTNVKRREDFYKCEAKRRCKAVFQLLKANVQLLRRKAQL